MDRIVKRMLVYDFDGEAPSSFDRSDPLMVIDYDVHGKEYAAREGDTSTHYSYDGKGRVAKKVKKSEDGVVETVRYGYYCDGDIFCIRTTLEYGGRALEKVELHEWNDDESVCRIRMVEIDERKIISWTPEVRIYDSENRLLLVKIYDKEDNFLELRKHFYREDGTLERVYHVLMPKARGVGFSTFSEYFNDGEEPIGVIRDNRIRLTTEYVYDDEENWIRSKVMDSKGDVIRDTIRQINYW